MLNPDPYPNEYGSRNPGYNRGSHFSKASKPDEMQGMEEQEGQGMKQTEAEMPLREETLQVLNKLQLEEPPPPHHLL
jgi:hypothetical protein